MTKIANVGFLYILNRPPSHKDMNIGETWGTSRQLGPDM